MIPDVCAPAAPWCRIFGNSKRARPCWRPKAAVQLPLAAQLRTRGLSASPIITDHGAVLDQAMEPAIMDGLPCNDALYLELAHRESIPLAPPDRRLNAAAMAAGVESLG